MIINSFLTLQIIFLGTLPIFKYEKLRLTLMRKIKEADVTAASFFNQSNANVAVGSSSGSVKIFDVKDKFVSKTLCHSDLNNPVRFLRMNIDDNYCAVSPPYCKNPIIKVFGLTTSKLLNQFQLEDAAEIVDLNFSAIKKSYLGCCTLEGAVIVWDIFSATRIFSVLDVHPGAGAGMALSPINHAMLASVGLCDGFRAFDIRSNKSISHVSM